MILDKIRSGSFAGVLVVGDYDSVIKEELEEVARNWHTIVAGKTVFYELGSDVEN